MAGMDVRIATDVGRVRTNNEDAYGVGANYLVVCDGMGGHAAGEVAASLAVQIVSEANLQGENPEQEICAAIEHAQERILAAARANPSYNGMGTTITLALLKPTSDGSVDLTIGHVGDSRAYIYSDGVLEQLTSDHSVVGELVRAGKLTASEARNHDRRHVLTQALGSSQIEVELISRQLPKGSIVLLCTDGLTDVVDDSKLAEILARAEELENPAQVLVNLANEAGGPDNVTVLLAIL
ncbi:MAG: Stp1/IreP family PP2C-type Ser/Thr phosphatase [Firmicutes bacterium]|nr:Stp1/IreP family PP2C-type Ser/Thr phosphatase [Bacillota bacterium]